MITDYVGCLWFLIAPLLLVGLRIWYIKSQRIQIKRLPPTTGTVETVESEVVKW